MLRFRKSILEFPALSEPRIMEEFPAPNEGQVTLANWRLPPFNRWSFHHVREIVPSATIHRSERLVDRIPLRTAAIERLGFQGPDGKEWLISEMLSSTWTDGFLVMQGGQALMEWYDSGLRPEIPHIVMSVSKSISAVLAGVVIGDGRLDPDAPVTQYIPEVADSAYGGDCTVRHVLDMTVSVNFIEDYLDSQGDFARYRVATGWNPVPDGMKAGDLRSFLTTMRRGPGPHGKIFHYVSPNSDLLGWILERASGKSYANLLSDAIWRKLGTEFDAYITVDRTGAPRSAGGICATLRDLGRFGEMVRNRGKVDDTQVVPDWWIDDIRTKGDPAAWAAGDLAKFIPGGRYRGKWYNLGSDRGAFCAIGIHGQWIYIDPISEVVIVKLSSQPMPLDDKLDHLLLIAFDAIARKLG
jgi:CubicO group peptidase (beta-lactamase class C family)